MVSTLSQPTARWSSAHELRNLTLGLRCLRLQAALRYRRGHTERARRQQTRPRAVVVETGSGGSLSSLDSMDDAEPPGTASEAPAPLTELEGVVLDFSLGFTQKMLKVCAILDRNPARAASRLAEVRARADAGFAYTYKQSLHADAYPIAQPPAPLPGILDDVARKTVWGDRCVFVNQVLAGTPVVFL
jgi:hypothetical protein